MKKIKLTFIFTINLLLINLFFISCSDNSDITIEENNSSLNDFAKQIESVKSQVLKNETNYLVNSRVGENNIHVNQFLKTFELIEKNIDYLYDENQVSLEAIKDSININEANKTNVKILYLLYNNSEIIKEQNFTPKYVLNMLNEWKEKNNNSLINESPFYSNYGRHLLNTYINTINNTSGNENTRLALSKAFYNVVENNNNINASEKKSLLNAMASETAVVLYNRYYSTSKASDPCHKATSIWLGGTFLTALACDGCAVGTYIVTGLNVIWECS